jgi:shikimate kinase
MLRSEVQPIVLLGFMGCGKSTLGRELATVCNRPFIDLDQWVESSQKLTVSELFARHGEHAFRELERRSLLEALNHQPPAVIALGGGAPCFGSNMIDINRRAISIFLDVSITELVHRLSVDRSHRPLLSQLNSHEVEPFVAAKLAERRPFYEQAHHLLQGNNLAVEDLLAALGSSVR